jgi:hypothetical protein
MKLKYINIIDPRTRRMKELKTTQINKHQTKLKLDKDTKHKQIPTSKVQFITNFEGMLLCYLPFLK